MRRLLLYILLLSLACPFYSCNQRSSATIKVTKPKYRHSWYDRKKNKGAARTKIVRMKT